MGREARAADKMRAAISLALEAVKFKNATFLRKESLISVIHTPPLKDGKQYYLAHMLCVVNGTSYIGGFLMTGEEDSELLQARALLAEEALFKKLDATPTEEVPVDAPSSPVVPVDV